MQKTTLEKLLFRSSRKPGEVEANIKWARTMASLAKTCMTSAGLITAEDLLIYADTLEKESAA